jgi:hypothetical protein
MEIEEKRLKKMFPNLARELESEEHTMPIASVRSNPPAGENASSEKFSGYKPDVIDFLRRCDDDKQAEEMIDYLEKRKEVNPEYARKLRNQLKEKGIRSFGSKKEEDYYSKQGCL